MVLGQAGNRRFVGSGRPRRSQKNITKGGGRSHPPFGKVFGAAGAAQTFKIDDFRPAQQPCINNPSVHGIRVYLVPGIQVHPGVRVTYASDVCLPLGVWLGQHRYTRSGVDVPYWRLYVS